MSTTLIPSGSTPAGPTITSGPQRNTNWPLGPSPGNSTWPPVLRHCTLRRRRWIRLPSAPLTVTVTAFQTSWQSPSLQPISFCSAVEISRKRSMSSSTAIRTGPSGPSASRWQATQYHSLPQFRCSR